MKKLTLISFMLVGVVISAWLILGQYESTPRVAQNGLDVEVTTVTTSLKNDAPDYNKPVVSHLTQIDTSQESDQVAFLLTGSITNMSGMPIEADITIRGEDSTLQSREANGEGFFSIALTTPGVWSILVEAPGHTSWNERLEIDNGGKNLEIVLEKTATLVGWIEEPGNATGTFQVILESVSEPGKLKTAYTNSQYFFEMSDIYPGEYDVYLSWNGYRTQAQHRVFLNSEERREVWLKLPHTGKLQITGIYNDLKKLPRQANLLLHPKGGGQDINLDFTLTANEPLLLETVPVGDYVALIEVAGLAKAPYQDVHIQPNQLKEVNFNWDSGAINGEVFIGGTLESDVEVKLWELLKSDSGRMIRDISPIQTTSTDENGLFNFSGLSSGHYLLEAKTDKASGSKEVSLNDNQSFYTSLTLNRGQYLQVVARHNGSDISNALISVVRLPYAELTKGGMSQEGSATIIGPLSPGEYYVRATYLLTEDGPLVEARENFLVNGDTPPSPITLNLN